MPSGVRVAKYPTRHSPNPEYYHRNKITDSSPGVVDREPVDPAGEGGGRKLLLLSDGDCDVADDVGADDDDDAGGVRLEGWLWESRLLLFMDGC